MILFNLLMMYFFNRTFQITMDYFVARGDVDTQSNWFFFFFFFYCLPFDKTVIITQVNDSLPVFMGVI